MRTAWASCIDQNPEPNTSAQTGSTVTITVGTAPTSTTTTGPTTTTSSRARPPRERREPRARTRALVQENGRHELPWRATRDRWLVLVSEVMLRQTQAPRVAQVYGAIRGEHSHARRDRR